ncbi:sensor histidine kinase [Palleronia sp. LCG004]|uniref:sensor histidine kinase n=1 Tax=Palleronia sp. LCG004 TaxID=3079304 RepID=UPI002943B2D3|nr:sensor histidine kinase [Palleronia sp. LCG004]WOI56008.1 sensor histidine kinase [Palleronia sp. LCG004]
MLPGGRGIDGLDRLDIRLVALLGLALLPIGVIAMVQTYRVIDNANTVARSALIGATINAVNEEREALVQLRGAAEIAADLLPSIVDDVDDCSLRMDDFAERFANISFAGYINAGGIVTCGSSGVGTDISQLPIWQRFLEERTTFFASVNGVISRRPVVSVIQPVSVGGETVGYVALSVPQQPLRLQPEERNAIQPLGTMTLSRSGDVLSLLKSDAISDLETFLPNDRAIVDLLGDEPLDFQATSHSGEQVIYTIAPMIPNEIYALSIWRASAVRTGGLTAASAILFPLLMWLVSIGVAYFAVHRLVVRHIRRLRLRIRAFTTTRRILPYPDPGSLPSELREVVESFEQLTERIVRDEADLENSLHEKDVLLKEVHHRVKNNLQLISSMMNMQMRKTNSSEIKALLRRLQDRVLGLATIHRNLYRADVLSRVDSAQLISDLVDQIADMSDLANQGVDFAIDVDHVALYPDQAVPLSLLVTEALTNALKYVGTPEGSDSPWIELKLTETDGVVDVRCANSLGRPVNEEADGMSSGLGSQLMTAFVMQLDGEIEIHRSDDLYAVTLSFRTSNFTDEL